MEKRRRQLDLLDKKLVEIYNKKYRPLVIQDLQSMLANDFDGERKKTYRAWLTKYNIKDMLTKEQKEILEMV